jgi:hypothetical protein
MRDHYRPSVAALDSGRPPQTLRFAICLHRRLAPPDTAGARYAAGFDPACQVGGAP